MATSKQVREPTERAAVKPSSAASEPAAPKPTRAYLAIASPLAADVVSVARSLPEGELARIEATLRPLTAWRVPAIAEHAAALLDLMGELRRAASVTDITSAQ
jgi:hypothetical protein